MTKRFLEVEEILDLVEQRVFLFSDEQEDEKDEEDEVTTEDDEGRKGGKADV